MDKMIANKRTTMELLGKYQLEAKKKFGQNFLVDEAMIDKIISSAKIDETSHVIEIGPGLGALTQKLAMKAKQVIAYEIDPDMVEVLQQELGEYDNLEIVRQDFLAMDLKKVLLDKNLENESITIVSNLPYYLTSEILIKLCLLDIKNSTLVVMMQKEVASRILKTSGGKEANLLTFLSRYYYDVSLGSQVSKNAFIPRPKVDSSVLVYTYRKDRPLTIEEESIMPATLKALYLARRKTIYNNLKEFIKEGKIEDILKASEIPLQARIDDLEFADYLRLIKNIYQSTHQND